MYNREEAIQYWRRVRDNKGGTKYREVNISTRVPTIEKGDTNCQFDSTGSLKYRDARARWKRGAQTVSFIEQGIQNIKMCVHDGKEEHRLLV